MKRGTPPSIHGTVTRRITTTGYQVASFATFTPLPSFAGRAKALVFGVDLAGAAKLAAKDGVDVDKNTEARAAKHANGFGDDAPGRGDLESKQEAQHIGRQSGGSLLEHPCLVIVNRVAQTVNDNLCRQLFEPCCRRCVTKYQPGVDQLLATQWPVADFSGQVRQLVLHDLHDLFHRLVAMQGA